MNRTLGRMRGVVALLVLALCLPLIAEGQNQRTPSVTVINPDEIPVPVKTMNTVVVTGNVGLSGKPAVTIANTVPVNGSINIANATAANPLSVRLVKQPGSDPEPVHFGFDCTPSAGNAYCTAEIPLAAGKRLFVQHVAVQVDATLPGGSSSSGTQAYLLAEGAHPLISPLPIVQQTSSISSGVTTIRSSGSVQMVAFVDAEVETLQAVGTWPGGYGHLRGTLTGYYVPLP